MLALLRYYRSGDFYSAENNPLLFCMAGLLCTMRFRRVNDTANFFPFIFIK